MSGVAAARPLRSAGFNLLGAALPALALFISVPLIVQRLGAEAWGVLALVGAIVGSFGVVDFNAAAAALRLVAAHRARGEARAVEEVIGGSLLVHALLGLAGGAALWLAAGTLVRGLFALPPAWHDEAEAALRLAALAFAAGQVQACLQSLLQALQRYDLSGPLDAGFGCAVPLATIAVVSGGGTLVAIVAVRLALALLQGLVLAALLARLLPGLRPRWPAPPRWRALASFSAWAWLQRGAATVQAHADKLLAGAQSLLSLAAYALPALLVARLFGLLFRLVQPLFPLASALAAQGRWAELRHHYLATLRYGAWLNASVCLLLALFARDLLHLWLGPGVGAQAPAVLVLLAWAAFFDSLTQAPSQLNDGLGHPRTSGLAALLRAALGLAAAWATLRVDGAGIVALAASQLAVSAAMALGFVVVVHRRTLPWRLREVAGPGYGPAFLLLLAGSPAALLRDGPPLPPGSLALALAAVLAALALAGWHAVLWPEHRARVSTHFGRWAART